MNKFLALFLAITFTFPAFSCPETMDNYMSFDQDTKNFDLDKGQERHISKILWDEVLDEIQQMYQYFLTPAGITLSIDRFWDDPRTNGTVRREGDHWRVLIYGGYSMSRHVNKDVIARVACHELGHHFGGTVFYPGAYSWAAGEGQSDYWATLKCLRKYFENQDNARELSKVKVPVIVREKCMEVWKDPKDALICMRSSMAAKAWTLVMYNNDSYQFDTPDENTVKVTSISHPNPQCRLDTHFQGALCLEDHMTDTTDENYKVGTCTRDLYDVGTRPRCWYRPRI